MAAEVFIDTSGFYAQWDRNDVAHQQAKTWMKANRANSSRSRPNGLSVKLVRF
jgi:hypothetical protein